jgi:hypothetical protein
MRRPLATFVLASALAICGFLLGRFIELRNGSNTNSVTSRTLSQLLEVVAPLEVRGGVRVECRAAGSSVESNPSRPVAVLFFRMSSRDDRSKVEQKLVRLGWRRSAASGELSGEHAYFREGAEPASIRVQGNTMRVSTAKAKC